MNICVTNNFEFLPFALKCSFKKVKEHLFLEAFRNKDWNHPLIQHVLATPQCYPNLTYYIAYICLQQNINRKELENEMNQIKYYHNFLYLHPDCYMVLALSGIIQFPLHVINNYVLLTEQINVVEKLIEFGFDVNEKCKLNYVKYPYIYGYDYHSFDCTPICYASHLTAPILIKNGAKVDNMKTIYFQKKCLLTEKDNSQVLKNVEQLIQILLHEALLIK